jgi:hypothetical protein
VNGELAQLVALVSHARSALSGEVFALAPSNSTLRYVAALTFEAERRGLFRGPVYESVAASASEWYEHLVRTGCRAVQLVVGMPSGALPEHIASAFAGGGRWGAATAHASKHNLWRADWRVGDRNAAVNDKIWLVHYREFGFVPTSAGDSIAAASARLTEVLRAADDFARDAELDFWRDLFLSARQKLEDAPTTFEYHPDMLPRTGYRLEARKLLSSCERAWVFGGMGSWNDLGFAERELQERYDALTPTLYDAVLNGITAAVNHGI